MSKRISRREFLKAGLFSLAGGLGAAASARLAAPAPAAPTFKHQEHDMNGPHGMSGVVGEVDHEKNGFNPSDLLTDFDYGTVSTLANGQTLREYEFVATNKLIEVVPGIEYPAWTYNGRIPGPTIRATQGDRIRLRFFNGSDHPHTIHFHGIHPFVMDGVPGAGPGLIAPGDEFTYEFDADPVGLHLYHCHAFPLARHIAKGLYGAFIVDPVGGRPPADHEYIMVQAGYDIDFDNVNDFYHVNGIPFHYQQHPIEFGINESVRIYLVNVLEFDLINSFHLHANFFNYFPTGTNPTPAEYTDTIIQGQAQRGILEFSYPHAGTFMFHAHITEFAELGWAGLFKVTDGSAS